MNDPKLTHCFIGAFISGGFAWASWSQIGGIVAVIAGVASIWAAIETALWRRKQRREKK